MTEILDFATIRQAQRHVTALGRSSAYTRGGRPPIPRCERKWGNCTVSSRSLPCLCVDEHTPNPTCPYVTHSAAPIIDLTDYDETGYAVPVYEAHERARGEVIRDVDGQDVTIDDSAKRPLPEREEPEGPTRVDTGGLGGRG